VATLPSTPIRANTKPASPPPKRKNMNSTPHRGVYSIFRPTPGLNPSDCELSETSPMEQTTMMDTDEEQKKPSPGDLPGRPQE
jgi:hypothetical protein